MGQPSGPLVLVPTTKQYGLDTFWVDHFGGKPEVRLSLALTQEVSVCGWTFGHFCANETKKRKKEEEQQTRIVGREFKKKTFGLLGVISLYVIPPPKKNGAAHEIQRPGDATNRSPSFEAGVRHPSHVEDCALAVQWAADGGASAFGGGEFLRVETRWTKTSPEKRHRLTKTDSSLKWIDGIIFRGDVPHVVRQLQASDPTEGVGLHKLNWGEKQVLAQSYCDGRHPA